MNRRTRNNKIIIASKSYILINFLVFEASVGIFYVLELSHFVCTICPAVQQALQQ